MKKALMILLCLGASVSAWAASSRKILVANASGDRVEFIFQGPGFRKAMFMAPQGISASIVEIPKVSATKVIVSSYPSGRLLHSSIIGSNIGYVGVSKQGNMTIMDKDQKEGVFHKALRIGGMAASQFGHWISDKNPRFDDY